MEDKLKSAIEILTKKAQLTANAKDALQFSQSVQNLSYAYVGLVSLKQNQKK